MLQALIAILVICVVAGLVWWVIDAMPVPQPLNRYAKIAVMCIAVIALVYVLLGLGGISTGLPGGVR